MSLIAKECKQVTEVRRYHVECPWLADGETLTGVTGVIDLPGATAVLSGVQVDHTYRGFHYTVSGGDYRAQFNIIFSQATSFDQLVMDHVQFNIETNGGFAGGCDTSGLMLSIIGPTGPAGAGGTFEGASIYVGDGAPPSGGDVGQEILVGSGPPS